ncbi:MAG: putative nucleotidyltransferase [Phormidium sp. OSCR]|nr:MAG: putative nucleotidyltransferase [Phormidium sp. OSCR]
MTISELPIAVSLEAIEAFCLRYGVSRLSLFGSVLREDFTPHSDVDVLVEFKPGCVPGFWKLVEMEDRLTQQLRRRVDLRTPAELSGYFRDRVLREALQIYDLDF